MSGFLGIVLVHRILKLQGSALWCFGTITGFMFSLWLTYLAGLGAYSLGAEMPVQMGTEIVVVLLCLLTALTFLRRRQGLWEALRLSGMEQLLMLFSVGFGASLMFKTFRYDLAHHIFKIDGLVYSDFASHLPLIRSFSLGENLPALAPLFGGQRIRYHFLFYFGVGILERLGIPIDWALNLLSTLGFAGMLVGIVLLARTLFGDRRGRWVAAITLFLCLTSGSYALLTGFETMGSGGLYGLWRTTLGRVGFLSGGPYYNWDGTVTGLLWTLTIFTNQRHFAFGIAVGLFVFAVLLKLLLWETPERTSVLRPVSFLALILGLLPFFHGLSFTSFILVSGLLLPLYRKKGAAIAFLAGASLLALPQLQFLSPMSPEARPTWLLGYGLSGHVTIPSFLTYWSKNLGLKFFLIPFILVWLPRIPRYVVLAGFSLFVLANLMRFGPDVWTNHKFFNIWLIFVNLGAAYLLVRLAAFRRIGKPAAAAALLAVSLTGLLDLPPIYNDPSIEIRDWQNEGLSRFIKEQTPPNEIFATSWGIYTPVQLTGRASLCGWPYFSWSAGFNTTFRSALVRQIFETKDQPRRCDLMRQFGVRYILAGQHDDYSDPFHPDISHLRKTLDVVVEDRLFVLFDARRSCGLI
ncbi:MAG: hypothetical protein V1798_06450 [Pseudomonadota bacterium]